MTILRIRSTWQNWPGAPGITDFYSRDLTAATYVPIVRAFFDSIKALLPTGLSIQTSGSCDEINEVNGQLTGSQSTTTPAVVTGSSSVVYAGASGACVTWNTAGVIAGKRVRGRTFLVPLITTCYDTNGSLSATTLTTLGTSAAGLITSGGGEFVVFARPRAFTGGQAHPITGATVPDLAAVLRSRRT